MAQKGKITIVLDLVSKGLRKGIDGSKKSIASLKSGFRSLGKAIVYVTGVIVLFTAASLKQGAALKSTLTMVTATDAEIQKLGNDMLKTAREMSGKLNLSASSILTGYYQVLSTGAKAGSKEFDKFADTAFKLAKVGDTLPTDTVENLADVTDALGFSLSEADKVADRFFVTTKLVKTNLQQFTEAAKKAGPVMRAFNVQVDEGLAFLAAFADKSLKGSEGGRAFRQVVSRLAAPVDEAGKLLEKMGVSAFDDVGKMRSMIDVVADLRVALGKMTDKQRVANLKIIAGEEGVVALSAILQTSTGRLRELESAMGGAGGALEDALDTKLSSGLEKLGMLKQEIINTSAEIGDELVPTLVDLAQTFAAFLSENKSTVLSWSRAVVTAIENVTLSVNALLSKLDEVIEKGLRVAGLNLAPKGENKELQRNAAAITDMKEKIIETTEAIRRNNKEATKFILMRNIAIDFEGDAAKLNLTLAIQHRMLAQLSLDRRNIAQSANDEAKATRDATSAAEGLAFISKEAKDAWIKEMARRNRPSGGGGASRAGRGGGAATGMPIWGDTSIGAIDQSLALAGSAAGTAEQLALVDESVSGVAAELDRMANEQIVAFSDKWVGSMVTMADVTRSTLGAAVSGVGNTLANTIVDGTADWEAMGKAVLKTFISMTVQLLIMLPIILAIRSAMAAISFGTSEAAGAGSTGIAKLLGLGKKGGMAQDLPSFAAGGYTGGVSDNQAFPAILHGNEMVIDAQDTRRNFGALQAIRAGGTVGRGISLGDPGDDARAGDVTNISISLSAFDATDLESAVIERIVPIIENLGDRHATRIAVNT